MEGSNLNTLSLTPREYLLYFGHHVLNGDKLYYYAVVDVNYIVTEIYESDVEMDESNFIPIDSYNMDLVGMWYDIETQTYSHVGNKYLIPLKVVDGAGSGLDADKLDGMEATAFALVGHTHANYEGVPKVWVQLKEPVNAKVGDIWMREDVA